MPTDKRLRQREGRETRRAEARAAQTRAARRRQIISVAALLAVVVGVGFLISRTGSDDANEATPAASPSTTESTDTTDTTEAEVAGTEDCPPAEGAADRKTAFSGTPKMCLDEAATYSADVETDVGKFTIDLDAKKAPKTVNSFVFLARYRAYEDVPFHRVIPGFVVQGGDVESGSGSGGPGYRFADELPEKGEYKLGSLAMANSGPNTNGSQFFVITGDKGVQLPPSYSLFGMVTNGLDVVKKIEADGSAEGTPTVPHKIVKVTIIEKKG